MTSIEQQAKHHEAQSADHGDSAEAPKAAPAPAIVLDTLAKYVAKALATKSPGFMRPMRDVDGAKVFKEGSDKPVMETYAQGPATDFLHATTGGLTEIGGEFCDQLKRHLFYGADLDHVNLGEELGDSWWYIAIALAATGHNLDQIDGIIHETAAQASGYAEEFSAVDVLELANEIAGYWASLNEVALGDFKIDPTAKVNLHGHPEAERIFLTLIAQTAALGALLGHDVRLVWQSNIAKLAKRYPNKFDSTDALFRRLDEERALLEANHDANIAPDCEAEPLARVNLKTFLEAQDGKFVGIDYIKKDGSDRSLNGRLGVTKFLKGGDNNTEALDRSYLTVYDMKARGYRTVDLASASHVRANGRVFVVTD